MKNSHPASCNTSGFKSVPVVRLDSGAIRVPVEFIENMKPPCSQGKAVCISVKSGAFWAWRTK